MKSWIFEFVHGLRGMPSGADVTERYEQYLEMWTRDEQRGVHGVMLSEHHFGGGYAPSPNLLLAALAQRTSTMKLGLIGSVTPYATPWRIAEEFSTLSHLTNGRMEMGVVSGVPPEFLTAGLDIPSTFEQHAEVCAVLDAARKTTEPIAHSGKHWSFNNMKISPPFRELNAPVWTACRGPESTVKAAQRGWSVCFGFNSAEMLAGLADTYRAAAAEAGQEVGPENLALRRLVSFADRPDEAAAASMAARQGLKQLFQVSAGVELLPPEILAILDLPDGEHAFVSSEEFIGGTPEQVAEQLLDQACTIGVGHVMIMFPEFDAAGQERSHEIFCNEVIPRLKRG